MSIGAATLLGLFTLVAPAPDSAADAPPDARPGGAAPDDPTSPDGPDPAPPVDGDVGDDALAPAPDDADDPAPPEDPTPEPVAAPAAAPPAAEGDGTSDPGEEPDGELTMDDIFGSAEEHEPTADVPVDVGTGTASDTDAPKAAAATTTGATTSRGHKFLDHLDTRFRIVSSAYYDVHKTDQRKFGRNENRLEFYFAYTPNEHLQIVGDVEPVFLGVAQARELDDLATRQMLTPFHVESDAAYVAINDLLPNLDLKVGRQIVVWGTADKFNPTNNINADDLEDRPLFTEPIANQMVVVDYAPLHDKLWFQGVYVPIFYPALLPPSAAAGLKDPQTPVPYAREEEQQKIGQLQDLLARQDGLVPTVTGSVIMPRHRFVDGQSAIKLGTTLGGVDLSISYYNGRHDIPTPVLAEAATKNPPEGPPTELECCYTSDVYLMYPRMQVAGLDFSTQLPFLGDMGLWGEGALFFPTPRDLYIEFPINVDVTPMGAPNDDGVMNPVGFVDGPSIRSTPYVKATAGFDYTFGKHVYVQLQYLRGFIDEFGADHIGNYLVGGSDLIFFGRHLIFRAFGVVDLPTGRGDDGSYVIYPELMLTPPWGSVTFSLGSFFLLGEPNTKFGQPATGTSIVFAKVIGTF